MRYMILILLLGTISFLIATPAWFTANRTPDSYIIGRSCALIDKKDPESSKRNAAQQALGDLANQLVCTVNAKTVNTQYESSQGNKTSNTCQIMNEVQVNSTLALTQYDVMKTENAGRYCYVQVGIKKEKLLSLYQNRVNLEIRELIQKCEAVQQILPTNAKAGLKQLEECRNLLQEIEQDVSILGIVSSEALTNLPKYPDESLIDKLLIQYSNKTVLSMEDMTNNIVEVIKSKPYAGSKFTIHPYDWNGTGFISDFGASYPSYLTGILPSSGTQNLETVYIMGHLIPGTEGLYLQTQIKKGDVVKYVSTWLNPATCEKIGWDHLKPLQLEQKLQDRMVLLNNMNNDQGLNFQVRTTEYGTDPALYHYDETPHLQVKTNQGCYFTLLYIESDGTKTALLQNYRLGNDQANEWFDLPLELLACPPAGIEQMLVQVSTEQLPLLPTKKIEIGDKTYKNIVTGSLSDAVAFTRGLKIKQPDRIITECTYQWTILP
jgi:hypothetical protein